MPLESSYTTTIMIVGTIFGQIDGESGASVRNNFGMKGRDTEAVFVDLKNLKYIIIGLK